MPIKTRMSAAACISPSACVCVGMRAWVVSVCVRLSVSPLVLCAVRMRACVCVCVRKAKEKDMLQTAAEKYLFFYLKMCVSVCVLLKA